MWVRRIGLAVTGMGFLTLIGMAVWQAVTWLPQVTDGEPTYFIQRYLFTVITLVDVPILPMTLAGLAMLIASRFKTSDRCESMSQGQAESLTPQTVS